jgi:hypothetical protein
MGENSPNLVTLFFGNLFSFSDSVVCFLSVLINVWTGFFHSTWRAGRPDDLVKIIAQNLFFSKL